MGWRRVPHPWFLRVGLSFSVLLFAKYLQYFRSIRSQTLLLKNAVVPSHPRNRSPKRKSERAAKRPLAYRSEHCRTYQLSRKPNSIVRLPPSNANLLRNVGEVTKMYPAFKGLAFCVESILPLLVGRPMLGLR